MADLTIPSGGGLVIAGTGSRTSTGVLGQASMTAGMPVYKHTDNKLYPCVATDSAMATCVGILATGGGEDQPCAYVISGNLDLGAAVAMTAGQRYYVSTNAGGIQPSGDLLTPEYVSLLGIADSTTNLVVSLLNSNIAL